MVVGALVLGTPTWSTHERVSMIVQRKTRASEFVLTSSLPASGRCRPKGGVSRWDGVEWYLVRWFASS